MTNNIHLDPVALIRGVDFDGVVSVNFCLSLEFERTHSLTDAVAVLRSALLLSAIHVLASHC